MGAKLVEYFNEAQRHGGMIAKLRLAGHTRVTSAEANALEDTPALLALFEEGMADIRRDSRAPRETSAARGDATVSLRKQLQVFLDLMTQRALVLGVVEEAVRRVNEAAADTLDVARVSVWFLSPDKDRITCADLFERGPRTHASGVELHKKDFPAYFEALEHERTIAAHDANKDPRTSCFSESYLGPLGIHSMLDVPIWVDGRMVGVVCHEHVGPARQWNEDEERFAYLMSSFVALAMERAEDFERG